MFKRNFSVDITENFMSSLNRLKEHKLDPDSSTKLRLYACYKQAQEGQCKTAEPPYMKGKAKHEAWKSFGTRSKEESMVEYTAIVNELLSKSSPPSTRTPASTTRDGSNKEEATASTNKDGGNKEEATASTDHDPYAIEKVAYPRRQRELSSLGLETVVTTAMQDSPGVYTVQLNRPERGNSFNMQMWHELREAFHTAEGDNFVRAIVLTGSSSSFSTGMDLSVFLEMQKLAMKEPCEGRRREALGNFIQFLQDAVSAPETCCVPVIAAVSGHCIGGAVDLITACDLRYCTDASAFCIKETDLAMVADVGTLQRLPLIIGDQCTRELAYTGRTIDGREAERLGLVLQSFPTELEMRQHVQKVATAIAEKSPLTIRGVKRTLLYNRDHTVKDSLEQVKLWNTAHLFSNDLLIAMSSMGKKGKPVYKGE